MNLILNFMSCWFRHNIMCFWSNGVLEWWSNGKWRADLLLSNTPLLQYPSTPSDLSLIGIISSGKAHKNQNLGKEIEGVNH